MPHGPGKYDPTLTEVLNGIDAKEGILIVLDGKDGVGFSVQASIATMIKLPALLETLANAIRADLPEMIEQAANGQAKPS